MITPVQPAFSALQAIQSVQPDSIGFAEAISRAGHDALQTIRAAETVAMDGIAGRATVQDVVDGVMAAERSFNTALAVRDKVVASWLELSRMAI
jgi:flagellar hook-basal body complex protein FliE